MISGNFFQNAACAIGLHDYGPGQASEQIFRNKGGLPYYEKYKKFRICANANCGLERGEERKVLYNPKRRKFESWTDIYWKYPEKKTGPG